MDYTFQINVIKLYTVKIRGWCLLYCDDVVETMMLQRLYTIIDTISWFFLKLVYLNLGETMTEVELNCDCNSHTNDSTQVKNRRITRD